MVCLSRRRRSKIFIFGIQLGVFCFQIRIAEKLNQFRLEKEGGSTPPVSKSGGVRTPPTPPSATPLCVFFVCFQMQKNTVKS